MTVPKKTILIGEDDKHIANALAMLLKANGYRTVTSFDGSGTLSMASSHTPDLIFLDLGLPDMDGLEVIKELRRWYIEPIIVISARGSEKEKVRALDSGADDYVTKPYGADELLARIRTALRRSASRNEPPGNSYKTGDFMIDFNKRTATLAGKPVHLTQVQYRIVEFISSQPGKVLTYRQIIEKIWGPYASDDNKILRVNMAHIRQKIEKDRLNPKYILTEFGVGYRMAEQTEDEEQLSVSGKQSIMEAEEIK